MIDYTKLFFVDNKIPIKRDFVETLSPSSRKIIEDSNYIGTITSVTGNFLSLIFESSRKTTNIVVPYSIINLGCIEHLRNYPHILYRILECQEEQGIKKSLFSFIEDNYAGIQEGGFYWDETKEGAVFWNSIMDPDLDCDCNLDNIRYDPKAKYLIKIDFDKLEEIYKECPIEDTNINNLKPNQHEIRLQKPHSVIIRGKVPKGSRVCSRKHKVTISSGHLSYSACSCRS